MIAPPNVQPMYAHFLLACRPMVFEAALDVYLLPQDLKNEAEGDVDQVDVEDSSFQASFSKLGASEPPTRDVLASIPDAKTYLSSQIAEASARNPGKFQVLMQPLPQETLQAFSAFMASNS